MRESVPSDACLRYAESRNMDPLLICPTAEANHYDIPTPPPPTPGPTVVDQIISDPLLLTIWVLVILGLIAVVMIAQNYNKDKSD